jgi:ubiquinone/menaquinone biosynthesis C-methylase UbiE
MVGRILVITLLASPIVLLILYTFIRILRQIYKFPMPHWMADMIDNPIRHRIQPPEQTPARHSIRPGMKVLEIGPGNGTYTIATARQVGEAGIVVAVDIEPRIFERVKRRTLEQGIPNVAMSLADVCALPFKEGAFDAIYMIAVIGEIPSPERASKEFHRVLSPPGTLSFSELLPDPDYPRASTLIRMASSVGFQLKERIGNFLYYTLIFEKA